MKASEDSIRCYSGLPVTVLGASGFIGRWVAKKLSDSGADLHLVVRDSIRAQRVFARYGIQGSLVELDLTDIEAVRRSLRSTHASIVFNLAGYGVNPAETDEQTARLINVQLLEAVCDAVEPGENPTWPGLKLVHVGSAAEYGGVPGTLLEDSLPNPTTPYGRSKLAGTRLLDALCQERGIKGQTARLFTVYGPGERSGRLLPSIINAWKLRETLDLTSGVQKRDFTYVEDVAEGLLRLGRTSGFSSRVVNLATGRLTSVRDFVGIAADIMDIPSELLRFGATEASADRAEWDRQSAPADHERLRQITDWVPPTDIPCGIKHTLEFSCSGEEAR